MIVVAGYAWTDPTCRWPRLREVVVVGEPNRRLVDELVARAMPEHRAQVVEYFLPMVEGGLPGRTGAYVYPPGVDRSGSYLNHLWWKPVTAWQEPRR